MQRVETRVGLQLRGIDLDPNEIANALRMKPNASHRPGERKPNDPNAVYTDGWCFFGSDGSVAKDAPFEEHAARLLDRLEPHAHQLMLWRARGYTIQMNVTTLSNTDSGGPSFEPELLRRISALGLRVCCTTVCTPQPSVAPARRTLEIDTPKRSPSGSGTLATR